MRVKLIACSVLVGHIPGYEPHSDFESDIDELGEEAGRSCYDKASFRRPNPATATNKGYLKNIIDKEHFSVMEHGSATFFIDGVTRNFTHEYIRHRHFSYSEISQRYVDVGDAPFIEHPGLKEIGPKAREDLLRGIEASRKGYKSVMADLSEKGFERKQARQAARHALPSGIETKILITGNMRAWRDMLPKRLSPEADEEFRQVAALILPELKKIAPNTFQDFDY